MEHDARTLAWAEITKLPPGEIVGIIQKLKDELNIEPTPAEILSRIERVREAVVATDHKITEINKLSVEDRELTILRVMKAEIGILKAWKLCELCRKKPKECVILPCGHYILCATCVDSINRCSKCDSVIKASAVAYLC